MDLDRIPVYATGPVSFVPLLLANLTCMVANEGVGENPSSSYCSVSFNGYNANMEKDQNGNSFCQTAESHNGDIPESLKDVAKLEDDGM